jgi:hypothetical protein
MAKSFSKGFSPLSVSLVHFVGSATNREDVQPALSPKSRQRTIVLWFPGQHLRARRVEPIIGFNLYVVGDLLDQAASQSPEIFDLKTTQIT